MSSARDESDDATDTHNHNISFAPASSSFLSGGLRSLPGLPSAAVEAAFESAEEILSSDSDGEGDNGSAVSQVPVQDTFSYNTHAAANARPGGLYQPARRPATSAIAPSAKRKPPSNEDPTAPVHTPASKLTDFYTNSMRTLSHLRVQASLASSDANASASNTAPGISAGVDAGTIHCAWLRTLYSSHPFTLVPLPPRAATLSSSAASAAVATAALDGQRPAQPDVLRPDARCYTAAAMRPPIPATGTVPLFSSPSTLGLSGLYHPRSVPSSMAAAAGTAPAAAEPGLGAEGLAQLLGMPPAAWTQINVPAGTHTAGSALQTHTQTLAASLLPVPPLTLGWLRPLWMRPLTAAPAATAALLAVLTLDQRGSAAENAPDGPDSGGAVERFLSAVAAAASATVLEGDFVDNVPASGVDVAAAFCADAGTALAASVAAVAAVASVFPAHLLALTQASLWRQRRRNRCRAAVGNPLAAADLAHILLFACFCRICGTENVRRQLAGRFDSAYAASAAVLADAESSDPLAPPERCRGICRRCGRRGAPAADSPAFCHKRVVAARTRAPTRRRGCCR